MKHFIAFAKLEDHGPNYTTIHVHLSKNIIFKFGFC
jgi:hypothetical protein